MSISHRSMNAFFRESRMPTLRVCNRLLLSVCCVWFVGAVDISIAMAGERPNIVFIFSDDHACQAIGAYGSQLIDTPHIDRLAKEGLLFERCYVTNSICGPSRACILTGKYSHRNGYFRNDQELNPAHATFPELLQRSGYQTALIGKWHLGKNSLPQGFDHWRILDHQGYYYQPKIIDRFGQTQQVGYVTGIITDHTLNWLEKERDGQRPFLLMMQHKAPHRPWDPCPEYLDRFVDRTFPEPATLFDTYDGRTSAARRAEMTIDRDMSTTGPDLKAWDQPTKNGARDWFYNKMTRSQYEPWIAAYATKNARYYKKEAELKGEDLVRWKYQRFLQDYLACVASVDDSIGQVLKYLDDSGLTENTIVIYSSDQGFFLGEHGWFDKRFMYEPSLRTPLVVRWPRAIKPGRTESRIVSNVDFAQTFLELAGVQKEDAMQGMSFVPLLKGESPESWRDDFYYHYYEGLDGAHAVCAHEGVTTGKHKLIHFYPLQEWELFDLENDPDEVSSVWDDPNYAAIRAEMTKRLERLRGELAVE